MEPTAMRQNSPCSLDRALERLRAHRLPYRWDIAHFHTWHAVCPSCRAPVWGLILREYRRDGALDLRCSAGCTYTEVHAALERDPAEARIEVAEARTADALELAEQARAVAARAIELATNVLGEQAHARLRAAA
jgi:hypothetical protein